MSKQILILTSCIVPNTSAGNIVNEKIDLIQKCNQLNDNINNLIKAFNFDLIIIIDGSENKTFLKLKEFIKNKKYINNPKCKNIKIISPNFDDNELEIIREKGKGASEILMVSKASIYAKKYFPNKSLKFYKISSRYNMKNAKKVMKDANIKLNSANFVIRISHSLSQTISIFYAFKNILEEKFTKELAKQIDDHSGVYLEHIIYNKIIMNPFCKSKKLKIHPFFPSKMYSGSHGRRLSNRIQFLHFLATII